MFPITTKLLNLFYASVGKAPPPTGASTSKHDLNQESTSNSSDHQSNHSHSSNTSLGQEQASSISGSASGPSSTTSQSSPSPGHRAPTKSQQSLSTKSSSKAAQAKLVSAANMESDHSSDLSDVPMQGYSANNNGQSSGSTPGSSTWASAKDVNDAATEVMRVGITCLSCAEVFDWDVVGETIKALTSTSSSGLDARITCPKCKHKMCHFCNETSLRRPGRTNVVTTKGAKVGMCCEKGRLFLTWAISCGIQSNAAGFSPGDDKSESSSSASEPAPRRSSRLLAKAKAKAKTTQAGLQPKHLSHHLGLMLANKKSGTKVPADAHKDLAPMIAQLASLKSMIQSKKELATSSKKGDSPVKHDNDAVAQVSFDYPGVELGSLGPYPAQAKTPMSPTSTKTKLDNNNSTPEHLKVSAVPQSTPLDPLPAQALSLQPLMSPMYIPQPPAYYGLDNPPTPGVAHFMDMDDLYDDDDGLSEYEHAMFDAQNSPGDALDLSQMVATQAADEICQAIMEQFKGPSKGSSKPTQEQSVKPHWQQVQWMELQKTQMQKEIDSSLDKWLQGKPSEPAPAPKPSTNSPKPEPASSTKSGSPKALPDLSAVFTELISDLPKLLTKDNDETVAAVKKNLPNKIAGITGLDTQAMDSLILASLAKAKDDFKGAAPQATPADISNASMAYLQQVSPAAYLQQVSKKHKLSPDHTASKKDWRSGVGYGSGGSFGDMFLGGVPWYKKRRTVAAATKPKNASKKNRVLELYFRALTILLPNSKGKADFDRKCEYGDMLTTMLIRSPLLSTAKELLRNTSITDITNSIDLYDALMEFLFAASQQPLTLHVMTDTILLYPWSEQLLAASKRRMDENHQSILQAIETMRVETLEHRDAASSGKGKSRQTPVIDEVEPIAAAVQHAADCFRRFSADSKRHSDAFKDSKDRKLVALLDRYEDLANFYTYQEEGPDGMEGVECAAAEQEAPEAVAEAPDEEIRKSFHWIQDADKITNPTPGRMKKLLTDLSSLRADLPAGIYVRHGEERLDLMKVLIVGPQGTPYENGLFEFDLLIPADFPSLPPKMQFKTTGRGRVSFNPNLYANGYVCLSLLNTWNGPRWQKDSTLLQLLLSIQAMIFCEEPWYNEPGYEKRPDKKASENKNRHVQGDTIEHAMLSWIADVRHLHKPPKTIHGMNAINSAPPAKIIIKSLKAVSPAGSEEAAAVKAKQSHSANGSEANVVIKQESPDKKGLSTGAPALSPLNPLYQAQSRVEVLGATVDSGIWDDVVKHHFSTRAEVIIERVQTWDGKRYVDLLRDAFRRHKWIE